MTIWQLRRWLSSPKLTALAGNWVQFPESTSWRTEFFYNPSSWSCILVPSLGIHGHLLTSQTHTHDHTHKGRSKRKINVQNKRPQTTNFKIFIDFAFIFAQMKNGGLSLIIFIPDTLFAEKKICKTKKTKWKKNHIKHNKIMHTNCPFS